MVIAAIAATGFKYQVASSKSPGHDKSRVQGKRKQTTKYVCPSARAGLSWYIFWIRSYKQKMDVRPVIVREINHRANAPTCSQIRQAANFRRKKAREWRARFLVYSDAHYLKDRGDWHDAISEAQRPYPGTSSWLYSCSHSEGGWGRWVGYGGVPWSQSYEDSDGVGGNLQFRPSTFRGFIRHAIQDVQERGFRVPASAWSWRSTLGQALAGAWGYRHNMRHHWAGNGC